MMRKLVAGVLSLVVVLAPAACIKPKADPHAELLGDIRDVNTAARTKNGPGEFATGKPGLPQVPKLDVERGPVPPLPGMPGSASRASLERPIDADDASAAEGERNGPIRRLIDKIKDRTKPKNETLPPAVVPREPLKPDDAKPVPSLPPATVPDSPMPKATERSPILPVKASTSDDLKVARQLVDAAAKKFKATADFEATLTKRETVGGKKQPTEEARFLYRQEPFSVRLTVTGEAGKGREVLYVKGQNDDKLTIVTGQGDNRLVGAGFKITLDKDDKRATERTRGKIDDSGLGRPIRVLTKFVDDAESGKRPVETIASLGSVERKEFANKVAGIEVKLQTGDDPLMPKGGRRQYFFDTTEKSPSRDLPVLVITYDKSDAEVEYYCFADFKLPAKLTDADFDPAKLGKKR